MKRLEILLLASFVGIVLLAIGCGGSGDTKGTTPQDQPAASAPAEASKPATEQAAATEPSEAGAADQGAAEGNRPARRRRPSRPPPVRGIARVQVLTETKVEGNEVISTIRARNVSKGSITRFTASAYWYDEQGNVTNVEVLKGLPMGLAEAAVSAVKQWQFKPATLNGKPVAVYFNLTVNFQLQ